MQRDADSARGWQIVLWAALALSALLVGHDVDHFVNEDRLGRLPQGFPIFLVVQYAVVATMLGLILRRDRRAPLVAAIYGAVAVFGFIAAHVAPFGPLPYTENDPAAISWALVFIPVAVALVLVAAAMRLHAATRLDRPAL